MTLLLFLYFITSTVNPLSISASLNKSNTIIAYVDTFRICLVLKCIFISADPYKYVKKKNVCLNIYIIIQ